MSGVFSWKREGAFHTCRVWCFLSFCPFSYLAFLYGFMKLLMLRILESYHYIWKISLVFCWGFVCFSNS